jgi:hypothetical protein
MSPQARPRLGAVVRGRGSRGATAARTPFVILIVTLLGGGLIALLLLNSAVNSDSFKLDKLEKETTGYTDEQQQLQQEVNGYGAPGELERRARELGMVPGGNPAFLGPDGSVHGSPQRATAPPPPPKPATTAPATPPAGSTTTPTTTSTTTSTSPATTAPPAATTTAPPPASPATTSPGGAR